MGEPEKINVNFLINYLFHMKVTEIYLCFHNSCEI